MFYVENHVQCGGEPALIWMSFLRANNTTKRWYKLCEGSTTEPAIEKKSEPHGGSKECIFAFLFKKKNEQLAEKDNIKNEQLTNEFIRSLNGFLKFQLFRAFLHSCPKLFDKVCCSDVLSWLPGGFIYWKLKPLEKIVH